MKLSVIEVKKDEFDLSFHEFRKIVRGGRPRAVTQSRTLKRWKHCMDELGKMCLKHIIELFGSDVVATGKSFKVITDGNKRFKAIEFNDGKIRFSAEEVLDKLYEIPEYQD